MQSSEQNTPKWAELLHSAVTVPGKISEAYSRFHSYSIGNQLLAMWQCEGRGIQPGPIGTFMHWKENKRSVRKGEKALCLCMPITGKRTEKIADDAGNESEVQVGFTRFTYKNNWFVLSQTDGEEYQAPAIPGWEESKALETLNITRAAFDHMEGNVQGYASKRSVAVSPLAALPHKTLFHELAHVVLGHTTESQLSDGDERTPRDIRELEAEATALICCESLGMPGADFCRGYIQGWYKGNEVPEKSAQKIFRAADQILKAGVL